MKSEAKYTVWKNKQQYLWVLGAIGSFGLAVTGFHQTAEGESSDPIIGYIFAAVVLCLSIYCIWRFLRARKNY
ncbi:DUF202 domain-containing protein [Dictyobacter halimunensis]|uniref:DUF202 domain-containing protein n=1 Tax=Dictyobacter halimunensis TaxID=3026934 RepID=UPI003B98220D